LALIGEFARLAAFAVTRARADIRLRQLASVFESTREGIILTVNRAYTDITGYAEDEVRGQRPNILQSGRQNPSFYQTLWASVKESG
jgi:PAS domain S-box-containing protein